MKRMVCILMTLLILILAGCQKEAESPIDAALHDGSTTVTFDYPRDYEKTLIEMGFTEFRADIWRPTQNSAPPFKPVSLTYNDDSFRLDFDYLCHDQAKDEFYVETGWCLYGQKNAAAPENISPFQPENYDASDVIDWAQISPDFASDFVKTLNYIFYNEEGDRSTCLHTSYAYFYPITGNLYNLTYEDPNPNFSTSSAPHVLFFNAQEAYDYGYDFGDFEYIPQTLPTEPFLDILYIFWDNYVGVYDYQHGMTLADWCQSQWNTEGWVLLDNNTAQSPDGKYYIPNADMDLREFEREDECIIPIPY